MPLYIVAGSLREHAHVLDALVGEDEQLDGVCGRHCARTRGGSLDRLHNGFHEPLESLWAAGDQAGSE